MMTIIQHNYQDPPSQLQWLRVAISTGMAEANLDYRKTVWGVSE